MAGRSGPLSTLFSILFSLPFVVVGVVILSVGLRQLAAGTGSGLVVVVAGGVFAGAGLWQVVKALRGTRSAEEQALDAKKNAPARGDAGEMPIVRAGRGAAGYRVAALGGATAREAYREVLDVAPLPKVEARPGQVLSFALGLAEKSLAFQAVFALIWNVFVWPFFLGALGSGSILATLFSLLFVGAGAYLAISTIRRWLSRRKLARVEIDAEPAYLGSEARIHLEQGGPARISRYRVSLVCREEVKYTVGTGTRTETHDVIDQLLLEDVAFRIGLGETRSHELVAELPAGAPPSFASEHNRVLWLIRVRAEIDGWPDYDEAFAFRALPRPGT